MTKYLILFLVLNFGGLAIGGLSTGSGVSSEWYQGLNKAPWTPPGWVFGAAWTLIMVAFSVAMAKATIFYGDKNLWLLYGSSWLLNVAWNPIFFSLQKTGIGLMVIMGLLVLIITIMLWMHRHDIGWQKWLLAPYILWLIIATSLNAYVVINN